MSLPDLQVAAPEYMSPDVVAKAAPSIKNQFSNVVMAPDDLRADLNAQPTVNIDTAPIAPIANAGPANTINTGDPDLSARADNVPGMTMIAQGGGLLADCMDACASLKNDISEGIQPPAPANNPAPPTVENAATLSQKAALEAAATNNIHTKTAELEHNTVSPSSPSFG
jgi:hypothetical protein